MQDGNVPEKTHETPCFRQRLATPIRDVWRAIENTDAQRVGCSLPEAQEYDHDDLRTGGSAAYRCGPIDDMTFQVEGGYLQVDPRVIVVHTDKVGKDGELLAAAMLAWEFVSEGGRTRALKQLADMLEG